MKLVWTSDTLKVFLDGANAQVNMVLETALIAAQEKMNKPNWQHNSGKEPSGRGCCKGKIRASKQSLRALKAKLKVR